MQNLIQLVHVARMSSEFEKDHNPGGRTLCLYIWAFRLVILQECNRQTRRQ